MSSVDASMASADALTAPIEESTVSAEAGAELE
jgi:hypothetical protein